MNTALLIEYGAKSRRTVRGELLFGEGATAFYFFWLMKGEVGLFNQNPEGRAHLQEIVSPGRGLGAMAILADLPHTANAECLTDVEVLRLPAESFSRMLMEHPEMHLKTTAELARRLHYQTTIAAEISMNPPEERILRLLRYLKLDIYQIPENQPYTCELTRQQIANLTGQRVETTIRAVKKLEEKGELRIQKRKIVL